MSFVTAQPQVTLFIYPYAVVRAKFNSHVNLLNDNFLFSSKQAAVAEVKLKHSESLITTPNCEKEVTINNNTHKTSLL